MCPNEKGPGHKSLQAKWDERDRQSERVPQPAAVLAGNLHLLPLRGAALDLACGLGASGLLLAEQCLDVTAWDLSTVAIEVNGSGRVPRNERRPASFRCGTADSGPSLPGVSSMGLDDTWRLTLED